MKNARGFTFIEVLVSLFIISIMLLLLQAVIRGAYLVVSTRDQDAALTIARNKLETLRAAGYTALPASGPFTDSLLATIPYGSALLTVSTANTKTKQVTATVLWQERNKTSSSSVSLTTLITEVGGLQ